VPLPPGRKRHIALNFLFSSLLPAKSKRIIHEYGESLDTEVAVYSLEEIILEKLRAIL